jgi:hypothetical protein
MGYDKITTESAYLITYSSKVDDILETIYKHGNSMSPISIPRIDFKENLQTSNKKKLCLAFPPKQKTHTHIVSGK